jgi:CHASE1-domain containing sensor protein
MLIFFQASRDSYIYSCLNTLGSTQAIFDSAPLHTGESTFKRFFSTLPYTSSLILVVEGGGKEGPIKE